ncbi:MAG: efflux RND transporter periplasmic adaptor subunit [Magnetospirillum sp.]|nr:efflux RND transporter periplasmic adaptor subunit [Magnetospirillum sp.]
MVDSRGRDWGRPRAWWLAVMAAALLTGCGERHKQAAQQPPRTTVVVVPAEERAVRPSERFTGRVEALDEVHLIARVQGFLEQRLFTEGSEVKRDQLLFVLQREPFLAEVEEREADVARAQAESRNADIQFRRGQELLRTGNIPKAEVDRREAAYLVTLAAIKQAQAALDIARINLGYTEIRAPIDGYIGKSRFSEGALVGPEAPPLATIVATKQVYATFPVSERQLLEVRKKAEREGHQGAVVRLHLADGSLYPQPGTVDFIAPRADPGTDTVDVRAIFPNPDGILVPGQFANVVVETAQPVASLVVPQSALQIDQAGAYVMVVDSAGKVEMRRVTTGALEQSDITVTQGLKPGDKVIVEGVQKVRPGQEVQVSELPAQTPPALSPEGP